MIVIKKEKPVMSVSSIIHDTQQRPWTPGLDIGMSGSLDRHSPLNVAPDSGSLLSPAPSNYSSTNGEPSSPSMSNPQPFVIGSSGNGSSTSPSQYPPNHPLSGSKHLCSICGDRASGKHYGVYSCEGCKGFFKRTVRKDLTYACREDRVCTIDKRQRNRCQYCRYQKCMNMGMKREAVQEERQRTKGDKGDGDPESSSGGIPDMPISSIHEAESIVDSCTDDISDDPTFRVKYPRMETLTLTGSPTPGTTNVNFFQQIDSASELTQDAVNNLCQAADKQLTQLVHWAKHIPHFKELPLEDQVVLLTAGWNELLIAAFSHRSMGVKDGIVLATGLVIHRSSAQQFGVSPIYDRVLSELIAKMKEMKMDKTELGCLRSIVLFNPDAKGLRAINEVEMLREKVYAALEEYTRTTYPQEPGRFAKLLLRLPALRSIGLKCLEHLFLFKMIGEAPLESLLLRMLSDTPDSTLSA